MRPFYSMRDCSDWMYNSRVSGGCQWGMSCGV